MIDQEIKEVLDDHKELLENHDVRIVKLETTSQVMEVKFNNIEAQLNRIEASSISNTNALLQSNQSIVETLQKVSGDNTVKNSNRKEICINALKIGGSIIGILILGYFALRGVNLSFPIIK